MTDDDEFDEDDRIVAEKIAYTRATYGKLIARTREIITRHATRMDKLTEGMAQLRAYHAELVATISQFECERDARVSELLMSRPRLRDARTRN